MGGIRARDVFRDWLKEKGLRYTQQREVILDAFFSADRHITVEELLNSIKKKNPGIGYATVHRNLALLRDCGIADEIKIGNQKGRYEPKLGHEHHDHLICLKCGRFIEVRNKEIEKIQDRLAQENGFTPTRHKLEIYGLCKRCK